MRAKYLTKGRFLVIKTAFFQIIAILIISLFFFISSSYSALSSFLGGTVYLISYLFFAFFAFFTVNANKPKEIISQFVLGEFLKIVATVLLFIVIFKFIDNIQLIPLILTYISILIVAQIGSFMFKS